MELDEDPACVRRELDRVKTKTKPSAGGAIKDSIHLEHFLELSRRLATRGLTEPRVFVSSNTSDFSLDRSNAGVLHPELVGGLSAAGLEFFPSLGPALRHVGLFGTRPAPAGGFPPAPGRVPPLPPHNLSVCDQRSDEMATKSRRTTTPIKHSGRPRPRFKGPLAPCRLSIQMTHLEVERVESRKRSGRLVHICT